MTQAQTEPTPAPSGGGKPLLKVENLKTYFPIRRGVLKKTVGFVRAVDGIDFEIFPSQTLGLVGESGCGKTTAGRTLLRLIPATDGRVTFDNIDVFGADRTTLQKLRRGMQIIFQDPVGSLNPRMTVGRIVGEPITVHGLAKGSELNDRVAELLNRVGLSPDYASRYPHEFSGGQRQRIGIARALGLNPKFIVCDEPVSALDVSIQSQILNLLNDLQDEFGLSYLFIAHNLAVVEHFSDRVAVMYLGRIVETADRQDLYRNAKHPYTRALLSAVPEPKPNPDKQRIVLEGEVPSPSNPPDGCHFHPRCDRSRRLAGASEASQTVQVSVLGRPVQVMRRCVEERPELEPVDGAADHCAACHYADQE
ncbi:MAG: ATP-binding cassette domain-containing protein [Phycisphaeraceae bacterium]|nr:ATP-binding cassette domain-containing protein [Phycisphaeraceae bacterium]